MSKIIGLQFKKNTAPPKDGKTPEKKDAKTPKDGKAIENK